MKSGEEREVLFCNAIHLIWWMHFAEFVDLDIFQLYSLSPLSPLSFHIIHVNNFPSSKFQH
jgi:hypothetical protein